MIDFCWGLWALHNEAQQCSICILLCCCVILCLDCSTSMHTYDDTNWWKHIERHEDYRFIACVTTEVLVSVYNPVSLFFFSTLKIFFLPLFLSFFSFSMSRYLMWSFDHNSIHIINLFSGHTICFFALPIYFLLVFLFASVRIKSDLILHYCIASIC